MQMKLQIGIFILGTFLGSAAAIAQPDSTHLLIEPFFREQHDHDEVTIEAGDMVRLSVSCSTGQLLTVDALPQAYTGTDAPWAVVASIWYDRSRKTALVEIGNPHPWDFSGRVTLITLCHEVEF